MRIDFRLTIFVREVALFLPSFMLSARPRWLELSAPRLPEGGQLIFLAQRALKGHLQVNGDGCLGQALSLYISFFFLFFFLLCVYLVLWEESGILFLFFF